VKNLEMTKNIVWNNTQISGKEAYCILVLGSDPKSTGIK
jgi:hypothetical protein